MTGHSIHLSIIFFLLIELETDNHGVIFYHATKFDLLPVITSGPSYVLIDCQAIISIFRNDVITLYVQKSPTRNWHIQEAHYVFLKVVHASSRMDHLRIAKQQLFYQVNFKTNEAKNFRLHLHTILNVLFQIAFKMSPIFPKRNIRVFMVTFLIWTLQATIMVGLPSAYRNTHSVRVLRLELVMVHAKEARRFAGRGSLKYWKISFHRPPRLGCKPCVGGRVIRPTGVPRIFVTKILLHTLK